MNVLYNLSISLYGMLIKLASIFNFKARQWVKGRINNLENIREIVDADQKLIWVHCASLGEFEQGRSLIEKLKTEYPQYKLLLTFFSPSGFELRKNYEFADYIFYLPLDTSKNAKAFIEAISPDFVIFIKYEFWFNYLKELQLKSIPHIYVSSIFRNSQHFFKWYGRWFRKHLNGIDHFFVQNLESKKLLEQIGINQSSVVGDTRFDRVFELAKDSKSFPLIDQYFIGKKVLIAGSTWPPDEELLYPYLRKNPELNCIIAPHDTSASRIQSILNHIGEGAIRFSEINKDNILRHQVIVVDSVGILAHLYKYALVVYIGGGFGVAIHNIQEAVTYGKPVIFGPKHRRFKEAVELKELGGAHAINSYNEFEFIATKLLNDEELYENASKVCADYIVRNVGATKLIMAQLKNKL